LARAASIWTGLIGDDQRLAADFKPVFDGEDRRIFRQTDQRRVSDAPDASATVLDGAIRLRQWGIDGRVLNVCRAWRELLRLTPIASLTSDLLAGNERRPSEPGIVARTVAVWCNASLLRGKTSAVGSVVSTDSPRQSTMMWSS